MRTEATAAFESKSRAQLKREHARLVQEHAQLMQASLLHSTYWSRTEVGTGYTSWL